MTTLYYESDSFFSSVVLCHGENTFPYLFRIRSILMGFIHFLLVNHALYNAES